MSVEHIHHYRLIDARLGTGGQPTEAQVQQIAAAGYEGIINLGLLDPKYCLPDEAGLAVKLGLAYRHLPVPFDAPTVEDFQDFLAVMDSWRTKRIFVHCAANYRVSSFLALYGELHLGWTRVQADEHARSLWDPNQTWLRFLTACRMRWIGR